MKRSYLFALSVFFISVTAMLCSCTENGYDEWQNEPMSFTAAISGRAQTRATVDTARTAGSTLIVQAAKPSSIDIGSVSKTTRASTPDGVWPSGGANVAVQITGNSNTAQYTIANGKMTSGSPFYWMDKNSVTVTSWYPYSVSMPASWSVKGDQSTAGATDYAASDLLYASTPFTYGGSNNTLTYTHATAKVVINIVKANDVTSASSVSSVTIGTANSQIDLSGTVNSGAITATTSTIGYIKPYQTTPANATNYVATYSALVIPQDVSNKQFIAVTVGANTYYYKPTSLTLQGGNEYDYNVTILSATASPGTYYFSDGTWGTLADHATATVYPIGVVFSGTTSTMDKAHGWTHGYAMALTNAPSSTSTCVWSLTSTYYDETGDLYSDSHENFKYSNYNDSYTVFKNNIDGYSETQAIKSNGKWLGNQNYQNGYPAFWYAQNYGTSNESGTTNYAAPNGSSGWYLPSIGQWWNILVNLAGMSSTPTGNNRGWCRWYGGDGDRIDYPTLCVNSINSFFTDIATYASNHQYNYGTFDKFSTNNEFYWSSSEYSNSYAGIMYFASGTNLTNYTKSNTFRVRAVVAF